ncbi:D-sedoheptulose 7-phosphate isomerase [Candidatus Roizmanbacteria bacterium]|nr:D-sedoheptulose 7-phosphate isomerase [Candidatus Roizmanbacteria bacterium]
MLNLKQYIHNSIEVKQKTLNDPGILKNLRNTIDLINRCFKQGSKILIAGNGGSAADAQHFAAEIVGRYKRERKGYPAIALTTDTSMLTAWSNDYNFNTVFRRQIEALGKKGDVFIGISTSGNSVNVIEGVKQAKRMKIKTVCLLGKAGGKLKTICEIPIIIPSDETSHTQECHITLIHYICEQIEKNFK